MGLCLKLLLLLPSLPLTPAAAASAPPPAQPRGPGARAQPEGGAGPAADPTVRGPAATHAGESGPASPPEPAAGETPAPHRVLFGFPWRGLPAGLFVFLQITDAGKTA